MGKKSVKLRKRINSSRIKERYFLDIYLGKTKINSKGNIVPDRKTERLDLYHIINPKSKFERDLNKQNFQLAQRIQTEKQYLLNNNTYGITEDRTHENFIEYFKQLAKTKNEGGKGTWYSSLQKLIDCYGNEVRFKDIDYLFVSNFRDFLLKKAKTKSNKLLSQNSASTYFRKFSATLHQAVRDEIINKYPATGVEPIKEEDTIREFLTEEELQKLILTERPKKGKTYLDAFIFSCWTGIRFSDIKNLKWGDIVEDDSKIEIIFRQQKTKKTQYNPISKQALDWLGNRKTQKEYVFPNISNTTTDGRYLKQWVKKANINKNISFHCGRHTCATLLLTNDVDIYIIKEILGHKNLSTTEIYAKIIDKKLDSAITKIPTFKLSL